MIKRHICKMCPSKVWRLSKQVLPGGIRIYTWFSLIKIYKLFKVNIFQVNEFMKNAKPEDSTKNKLIQLNSNYILNMPYECSTELTSTFLSVLYLAGLVWKDPTSQHYKSRRGIERLNLLLKVMRTLSIIMGKTYWATGQHNNSNGRRHHHIPSPSSSLYRRRHRHHISSHHHHIAMFIRMPCHNLFIFFFSIFFPHTCRCILCFLFC